MKSLGSFILIIILFLPNTAISEESQLEEVRIQIEEITNQINEQKDALSKEQEASQKLYTAVKALKSREDKLKKDLTKLQANQDEVEQLIQDIKGRILQIEKRSLQRVRALYVLHSSDSLFTKISNFNSQGFSKALVYMKYIREMEKQDADENMKLQIKRKGETSKLAKLRDLQFQLVTEATLRRKDMEQKATLQAQLTSSMAAKRKELEEQMGKLKAQQLRMETVLRSLTGDETALSPISTPTTLDSSLSSAAKTGVGFGSLKHGFPAKVTSPFIVKSSSNQKGIFVCTESESVVTTIDGIVAYIGKMPGLGTVVIVSHGNRDFSLYGLLHSSELKKGDLLKDGQVIGQAEAAKDKNCKNLYIETRRKGNAVNPESIFFFE